MTKDAFERQMAQASAKIRELPPDQQAALLALLEETRQRHEHLQSQFARIHDAVAEWRLLTKYLLFDLEASRRELAELRRRYDQD